MTIKRFIELENNKRMALACGSILIGSLIMPHDDPVATIISKYIFPSTVAGICFGIAIWLAVDIMLAKARLEKIKSQKEERNV